MSGDVSSDASQHERETIQENSEPVQEISVKKKRVMSEAQKENLRLAREKAVLYRLQLKEEKEKMGIKDEKKLNKTQLKLLKLKEQREQKEIGDGSISSPLEEKKEEVEVEVGDGSGSSPSEEVGDYTEGKRSPSKKEKVVYAYYASANEDKNKNKLVVGDGRSPSTRPSFIKNENGFFCI